ncbi:hypothetical protein K438DRAFT_1754084 [Mycena galopus ATCC 62051]|nr:hypothetical protein K438DRAFT_1754084 [Mycena galopus ATCC 62051]
MGAGDLGKFINIRVNLKISHKCMRRYGYGCKAIKIAGSHPFFDTEERATQIWMCLGLKSVKKYEEQEETTSKLVFLQSESGSWSIEIPTNALSVFCLDSPSKYTKLQSLQLLGSGMSILKFNGGI